MQHDENPQHDGAGNAADPRWSAVDHPAEWFQAAQRPGVRKCAREGERRLHAADVPGWGADDLRADAVCSGLRRDGNARVNGGEPVDHKPAYLCRSINRRVGDLVAGRGPRLEPVEPGTEDGYGSTPEPGYQRVEDRVDGAREAIHRRGDELVAYVDDQDVDLAARLDEDLRPRPGRIPIYVDAGRRAVRDVAVHTWERLDEDGETAGATTVTGIAMAFNEIYDETLRVADPGWFADLNVAPTTLEKRAQRERVFVSYVAWDAMIGTAPLARPDPLLLAVGHHHVHLGEVRLKYLRGQVRDPLPARALVQHLAEVRACLADLYRRWFGSNLPPA